MKFDPTKDSPATAAQMLHVILIRELEAATSEEDLRARLRVALAPHTGAVRAADFRAGR